MNVGYLKLIIYKYKKTEITKWQHIQLKNQILKKNGF